MTGIKQLIGFRKNSKPNWRGKLGTLRLRFKKVVKADLLKSGRLQAIGLHPNPDMNSIEEIVSGLTIPGEHEYVAAFCRNISLCEFCQDGKSWLKIYVPMRNAVEESSEKALYPSIIDSRGETVPRL